MHAFNGRNIKDIESAIETPVPFISQNQKIRNISKSSSIGALSQMMESESFDTHIDKKNKELY